MTTTSSVQDRRGGLSGLRLTRRGRLALVLLSVLLGLAVWSVSAKAFASEPGGGVEVQTVTVQPGETLWRLAAGVAESGEDVRDVVQEIQELNGMESAAVRAGEQLLLPVSTGR